MTGTRHTRGFVRAGARDAVTEPPAIGGNGAGELNFAPLVPGRYTFHCDFHPGTMGGQVVID